MAWEPKDSTLYQNDAFMYQNPANTGIGDWYSNMDKWKSMQTGQYLTPEQVSFLQNANKNGVSTNVYGEEDPNYKNILQAMDSYTYRGDDGKTYMIGGSPYNLTPPDQEGSDNANYDIGFGGASGQGRERGEMTYSTTAFRPDWDGDMGAYNGKPFDFYDRDGKYVGGQAPMMLGDTEWDKWSATVAAIMATAGASAYFAPAAAGGAGSSTATLGEGALAASGNYGVAAGTAGAAGTNAAAAGAAGAGTAGATGGNGAFLGEGVQSGVPAWDGAAGGAAGGYGTTPLVGQSAPTAPGYGSTGSSGGMFGGGSGGSGGGMFGGSINIPGIGSVSTSSIMEYALPLLGALAGSQEQEQTTTSTKELPEWLQGPVYGNGGLIPQSQWLMNQQLNGPTRNQGLLRTVDKKKSKQQQRKRGLL